MEDNNARRSFLKYLFSLFSFAVVSIFSFKIDKNEGFKIGKIRNSFNPTEASGTCGVGMNCAGSGGGQGLGECGVGMNCAGGGGGKGF